MFWFITGLILTILSIIGLLVAIDADIFSEEVKKINCLWGLLWLLLMIPGFIGNVATGEVGIKTRWGKVVSTNLSEGIQIKAPWEKIVKMNIKVQKYENETGLSTSSKDLQVVNQVIIAVNYQLKSDKAVNLYRNVGEKYDDTILLPAIQESTKAVISKYTAEEIVTKRSEIANDITSSLNDKLNKYGVNVVSVAIKNFDFSDEYNKAIEQKAVAEQQVLTAKQQQEKAKVEAETKKIRAEGEASANKEIEKSLTEEILLEKFINKWDGKLPTTYAGDDVFKTFGLNK